MTEYDVDMMPALTWKDRLVIAATIAVAVVGAVLLIRRPL